MKFHVFGQPALIANACFQSESPLSRASTVTMGEVCHICCFLLCNLEPLRALSLCRNTVCSAVFQAKDQGTKSTKLTCAQMRHSKRHQLIGT